MSLTRKVFRAGIEYSLRSGAWVLSTDETPNDQASFEAACGSIPILIEDTGLNYSSTSLMLRSGKMLGVAISGLLGEAADAPGGLGDSFLGWKEVTYLLGALGYHCTNLAETYARVRATYARYALLAGPDEDDRVGFGNWPQVFYELDAVLGVARRTLDMSRFIVWRLFGSRSGCPSNFKKTLAACVNIPETLREVLERTWTEHGERITRYRDCIMHYTSLDRSFGTVDMDRSAHNVWMASAFLPDNPEVRSQRQFTHADGVDALDYAYAIVNVIFEALRALADYNGATSVQAVSDP